MPVVGGAFVAARGELLWVPAVERVDAVRADLALETCRDVGTGWCGGVGVAGPGGGGGGGLDWWTLWAGFAADIVLW